MLRWTLSKFVDFYGFAVPASFVFAFCNLLVNTALSIAFGDKAALKIGGRQ